VLHFSNNIPPLYLLGWLLTMLLHHFIGATCIPLMSIACVWYFTRLDFNCCSMVRALIGCCVNHCTCLGLASVIFASSLVHSESFLACDSTTSLRSTKLSRFPNSGSSISFITLLILLRNFFRIPRCGYGTNFVW
jgi:hypothetical protein